MFGVSVKEKNDNHYSILDWMLFWALDDYLDLVKDWEDPNPVPVIEKYDGIHVVRDDLQEGGSKVRFADKLIRDTPVDEFCYGGSNKVGWGNISCILV